MERKYLDTNDFVKNEKVDMSMLTGTVNTLWISNASWKITIHGEKGGIYRTLKKYGLCPQTKRKSGGNFGNLT